MTPPLKKRFGTYAAAHASTGGPITRHLYYTSTCALCCTDPPIPPHHCRWLSDPWCVLFGLGKNPLQQPMLIVTQPVGHGMLCHDLSDWS